MAQHLAVYEVQFGALRCSVRDMCGSDLLAVQGDDTQAALDLIDRLLCARGAADALRAAELTAPERDRVLAAIYLHTYGARISGSPCCARCAAQYDTDFDLAAFVAAVWPEAPPRELITDGGLRLRVPNGADEIAVASLAANDAQRALAQRCAIDPLGPDADIAELSAALERHAPVLDLVLSAVCPECGADNALTFRMQSYLLRTLGAERAGLASELDALARVYGWSATEILGLPRSTRLQLVRLAEGHRMRRAG